MGAPNITGTYALNMGLLIRASSTPDVFGQTMAASDCGLEAETATERHLQWMRDADGRLVFQ